MITFLKILHVEQLTTSDQTISDMVSGYYMKEDSGAVKRYK